MELKLDQVAKRKKGLILVDTNVYGRKKGKGGSFARYLQSCKCYSNLKLPALISESERMDRFMTLLQGPTIRTIPQVTTELNQYAEIIQDQCARLDQHGRKYKGQEKVILHQLRSKLRLLVNQSKEKHYQHHSDNNSSERYELLTGMVKLLNETMKIKKPDKRNSKTSRYPPLDTDERLVALSLTYSITNATPKLFSRDRDLESLLRVTPYLLGAKTFLPYNQRFRGALGDSLVHLFNYLPDVQRFNQIDLRGPNGKISFPDHFVIPKQPIEISKFIEDELHEMWEQFYNLDSRAIAA
jgi:hypothetical protein